MSDKATPALLYSLLYGGLRETAANLGYALAIHGSVNQDCDLIAVPWTEDAVDPETLVTAIVHFTDGILSPYDNNGCRTEKPHGRRVWCIHFGARHYIDLSVMPTDPGAIDRAVAELCSGLPSEKLERAERPDHERTCTWRQDDYYGYWETGCGCAIVWEDGGDGLAASGCNYCPNCGGRIIVTADAGEEGHDRL